MDYFFRCKFISEVFPLNIVKHNCFIYRKSQGIWKHLFGSSGRISLLVIVFILNKTNMAGWILQLLWFHWNNIRNLSQKIDAKNQKMEYVYDDSGRLVEIKYFNPCDHVNPVKTRGKFRNLDILICRFTPVREPNRDIRN